MSELKLPRLLAAAKEFNIGQDTLVEFLVKKGFSRDDLKPTAKLLEDQYYALQAEFQGDKVAKNKADMVEIPKGAQTEGKKKKDRYLDAMEFYLEFIDKYPNSKLKSDAESYYALCMKEVKKIDKETT